jgi:nicotinate-nucleotide pyrophosphorylase (carboxylating)
MELTALVAAALDEDLGPGDLTTRACVDPARAGRGVVLAKQDLAVSGQVAAAEVFRQVAARRGASVRYRPIRADGARVAKGTVIADVEGPFAVLLEGERTALNFLMRLSGIATHVRRYTEAAAGQLRVVDTRKTTPLLRELEKAAVRHGGGFNHRFGLFDGVMIKDNHIVAAGGITEAVRRVRAQVHHLVRVEVEVTHLAELEEALVAGADVILLDNMDDALLAASVARAGQASPRPLLEASGNMTPERIARIRDLGLDLVSAGGLVHQATWVDVSLDLSVLPDR